MAQIVGAGWTQGHLFGPLTKKGEEEKVRRTPLNLHPDVESTLDSRKKEDFGRSTPATSGQTMVALARSIFADAPSMRPRATPGTSL
jgi:hypothetical protein